MREAQIDSARLGLWWFGIALSVGTVLLLTREKNGAAPAAGKMKKCPECAEMVRLEAAKAAIVDTSSTHDCRCGQRLSLDGSEVIAGSWICWRVYTALHDSHEAAFVLLTLRSVVRNSRTDWRRHVPRTLMLCPYCLKTEANSRDHIFPEFLGGKAGITTCACCNNTFGHTN